MLDRTEDHLSLSTKAQHGGNEVGVATEDTHGVPLLRRFEHERDHRRIDTFLRANGGLVRVATLLALEGIGFRLESWNINENTRGIRQSTGSTPEISSPFGIEMPGPSAQRLLAVEDNDSQVRVAVCTYGREYKSIEVEPIAEVGVQSIGRKTPCEVRRNCVHQVRAIDEDKIHWQMYDASNKMFPTICRTPRSPAKYASFNVVYGDSPPVG